MLAVQNILFIKPIIKRTTRSSCFILETCDFQSAELQLWCRRAGFIWQFLMYVSEYIYRLLPIDFFWSENNRLWYIQVTSFRAWPRSLAGKPRSMTAWLCLWRHSLIWKNVICKKNRKETPSLWG